MKRILYVEGNEDGTVGGSHKILVDLVTRLSPEYEPVVLFYQDNRWAEYLRAEGLEVHAWDDVRKEELARFAGGKLRTLMAVAWGISWRRRFLRTNRIDLLHLNNSPHGGREDWLPAALLEKIPCAVYAMGGAQVRAGWLGRALMRRFDVIFPLSRLMEESLVENGVPRDHMVLTYPGVDLEEIESREYRPREVVRAEFGLREHQVLAVMVGNLRRWKGQHVVVEGVRRLPAALRDKLVVLLVGEAGPDHAAYEERLRRAIGAAGLDGTIRLTGRRGDVPDLLEAGDISIHASVVPEPFGLVVQEGMVHGCAPIAADKGGPVEMLTSDSGLLFDADHPEELTAHLRVLLEDPQRRREYASRAEARAREFDIRGHVRLIEANYARLLS